MFRKVSVIAFVVAASVAVAQPPSGAVPLRFKWEPNQTLTYKVVQITTVQETTIDEKTEKPVTTESKTNLSLVRKWSVKNVDAGGVATLDMAITAMRTDIHPPGGMVVTRDSANPEHAKDMAEFLNKPIVTVRVDSQGRLIEVKEAKNGSAARLQAELPFRLTLPDAGPTVGQSWDRAFSLKLDPPQGTGESHDFVQKYTCKGAKDGLTAVGVETALKAPPKATGEQVPLVPMLWTGDVYFHAATGRYYAARLSAKAELTNHLGDGSKFVYQSTYGEDAQ
jgi:hypothetical protein